MRPAHFLSLCLFSACVSTGESKQAERIPVEIGFAAMVGDAPALCGISYPELGSMRSTAELADARLFVSQLELRDEKKQWHLLELDQDTIWQSPNIALLDFEDGTSACADSGTPKTNNKITGTLPPGTYDQLRFSVGIPNKLNHLDNATATAPQNVPGMFWTWQGGYKFLRVDWQVEESSVKRWNFHLGATGCDSSAPTAAPTTPCARSNRPTVHLEAFRFDQDVVRIDFSKLIRNADFSSNMKATPPGCMSSPAEINDCQPLYRSLGLLFANGRCVNQCAKQTVFDVSN